MRALTLSIAAISLSLAGCEADPINARAVIEDWGYRAVGIVSTPALGRPCRYERVARYTLHPTKGWKADDPFVREA